MSLDQKIIYAAEMYSQKERNAISAFYVSKLPNPNIHSMT